MGRSSLRYGVVQKANYHDTQPNGGSVFPALDINQLGGVYDIKDANYADNTYSTHRASTLDGATLLLVANGSAQNRYLHIINEVGQRQAIDDRITYLASIGQIASDYIGSDDYNARSLQNLRTAFGYSDSSYNADFDDQGVLPPSGYRTPFIEPKHRTSSIMIPPNAAIKVKKGKEDIVYASNGINGRGGGPHGNPPAGGNPYNVSTLVRITVLEY